MYLDRNDISELADILFTVLDSRLSDLYLIYRVGGEIRVAEGYDEIEAVKEEAMKDPSRYFL